MRVFERIPARHAVSLGKRQVARLVTALGLVCILVGASGGAVSAASTAAPLSGQTVRIDVKGKAPEIHDAQWLSIKNSHRLVAPGVVSSTPIRECISPCDDYKLLNTSVVTNTLETLGYGPDDKSNGYTDGYLWNFCAAGAVDNALYYWNGKTNTYPAGWYTEPSYANYHTNTYWTSSDRNRSYEMYIADQVKVPTWGTPGMVTFNSYPSAGTGLADITSTLNWEASNHSSSWQNYFYLSVPNYSYDSSTGKYDIKVSKSTVNSDIVADIKGGHAVVVMVNTTNLPNWNKNGIIHVITIVGYDNTTGIYWYTDTCGTACGSMYNGGVHTINQVTPDQYGNDLYDAIINVGVGGGFSW